MLSYPARLIQEPDGGFTATFRDIPEAITQMLTDEDTGTTTSTNTQQSSVIRRGLLVASAMVVFGVSLWQIGIWG